MQARFSTLGETQYSPVHAAWPLLAALAGLAFCRVAQFPPLWALVSVAALCIPLVAILSGSWTRFFVAFMIFGFSLNLDKTFNHSGYIGGVGGLAVSLVDIALACLLVPAVIRAALRRTLRLRLCWPTTIPALALLAVMALSMATSQDMSLSFYHLLETSKLLILYLFVANFVQSEDDVQFMIRFLLAGVIFQGSIVMLQYLSLFPEELQTSLGFKGALISKSGSEVVEIFRPSGTIGHANILGAFLAMSLPIAISQVLLQPGLRRKLLPFLALCVGTTALVMSFSRGAWISFSAAATWVLLVAVVIGKLRGKHLLGVVISVAAVAFMVVTFSSLVESRIFDPDPGSAKDRMRLNELAWNMIQDHPLLGVGVNTFGKVMSEYDFTHFGPQNVVHNVYLLMTAESGVFALLAYLWLILAIGRQAVKAMRSKNLSLCMTATAILGGFVGLWFQMLVEILVTGPPVQVFWFFVGIIGGINGMQQRDLARASAPRRGKVRSPGSQVGDGDDEEGMAPRETLDDPWDRGLSRDGASR